MRGKELIRDMISTYFMLTTMILVVMTVLGTYFMPEVRFGYKEFEAPLTYAAWGTLPSIVLYAKKELTMKQMLVRKIIQLILIEVIVLVVALPADIIDRGNSALVISLIGCVFVIYLLTHIIEWYQDSVTAKKMTEELLLFQEKYKQE
ncbi:MAG: hypothetical protein IKL51_09525 [Lachnospiraceae bacterium]|nr:hypothetical protein [Lachnospiraceae bacterium]